MRVPLRWLSEYVDLTVDTNELARRLTVAGLEVAEIISAGEWQNISVGYVDKVEPHPNADRLVLATVTTGDGVHQVVCGAPNVAAGQKIAYASIGAKLIDGHTGEETTLKAAKIRGVESQGMICSEKELGISDEHAGILVLPEESKVGQPLSEVIGETILDIELTPNRPDWLSILGIAREAAAVQQLGWRDPPIDYPTSSKTAKELVKVEIEDADLCPRYIGAIIENVTVGESPQWMKDRLIAAGMRPINNVVDITNYVMLEMGQPLHAFDYDKVRGRKIIVRRARNGERMRLLTETEDRTLTDDMLVIADAEGATGVAGVMGGGDSQVSASTRTILLEAANFKGTSIRRTSGRLKLRTDASTRFEKGLPPQLPPIASARAVRLIVDLCGGQAASGVVDVFPGKRREERVTLTMERLTRVLGLEVPPTQVKKILSSLGFGVRWVPPHSFVVRLPYWRTDVAIADDLVEEVARIVGYDELPTTQLGGRIPDWVPQPLAVLRERVADTLVAAGMQQIITYSMSDIDSISKVLPREDLAINPPLKVANPLSRQYEYARTTLRHSALETLAANERGSGELIALFETARTYQPREGDLPHEVESLAGVVSGRSADRWGLPRGEPAGFFDAKARLEALFDKLHVDTTYREAHDFAYLPGRTAEVVVGDTTVGLVGEVHPRVAREFGLQAPVAMFEVNIEALLPHVPDIPHYEPISQFPPVEEDLAVTVNEDVAAARVIELIAAFPLVRSVRAFDVYKGDPIPAGKKSLAFAITYQSRDKTLTDEDVAKQRGRIIERLRRELAAEPRA
jgi:phenylalanyl-tRNA synthetase beta chain